MDGFDDNLRRRRQSEPEDGPEAESSEEGMDDAPSHASKPKGKGRLINNSQLTQQTQGLDDDEEEQPSRFMDVDGEEDDKPRLSAKAKGKQRAR